MSGAATMDAPNRVIRIVHLEDDLLDRELVAHILEAEGIECEITYAQTDAEFVSALDAVHPDIVISDFSLPSFNGAAALAIAQERGETAPFVFFSGTIGEEVAIDSLKEGATDYVLKQRPDRLAAAIRRALSESRARHEHQRALVRIHEQAALLDKAHDAIMVTDLEQRITYWNQGAARLYHWSAEEAIGQQVDVLLRRSGAPNQEELRAALEAHDEWQGEVHHGRRSGPPVIVQSRQTLVRDAYGRPLSVLAINTDITERKQLEAQFLRAQRLESVGALASGIAHDLNNILSPIFVATELLATEDEAESRSDLLQIVTAAAQRGADLVKQVLSFARGTPAGKAPLHLRHVVREIARFATDTFPRSITISASIPDDLPLVHADYTQLHQVLLNLCINARDAMPEGGTLTIDAGIIRLDGYTNPMQPKSLTGPFIVLRVKDSGIGIPPELRARIFEPFFTTKGPEKGTGLGLATVSSLVVGHGGFVEVESTPGLGTEFAVHLPALGSVASVAAPVSAPPSAPAGRSECILVVDDEAALRQMICAALSAFQYRPLAAADGHEALALFQQHPEIDLVFTDQMMPGMDGNTLLAELRKIRPQIRTILASGLNPDTPVSQGFSLSKPFTINELLATLRTAFEAEEKVER